jgi:hypothetical protein
MADDARLAELLEQGRLIVWASEHDHSDRERLSLYSTKHLWLARVSEALDEEVPGYVDPRYMPAAVMLRPADQ